jgi:thymidylate kinase
VCYFAPKPDATPEKVLRVARDESHGIGVYSNRKAVLTVLDAVAASGPKWWNDDCAAFVEVVRSTPGGKALIKAKTEPALLHAPLVLVEGLDGVGKTTVTENLAEKLGAVLLRTPDPALDNVRGRFRVTEDVVGRAFYSGANYLAAEKASHAILKETKPVVFDRWWPSTAAMAISMVRADQVPPEDSSVWKWPEDLPEYSFGTLLDVSEDIRLKRLDKRGGPNAEEEKLAAEKHMRERATEAYLRLGPRPLERVLVPTYMIAVNGILDRLEVMNRDATLTPMMLPPDLKARHFTLLEQQDCKPY